MSYDIKRGVSLYSFQEDYYEGRRTLEQCIAATAELGAVGIETLAEQMMPGFPRLSDEFYDQFAGWMTKYGTVSVAHDMFLDTKRYKDRLLTDSEMIESLKRDIDHAYKLKASAIRIIVNTPPAIVEAAAPYARDKGIKMGVGPFALVARGRLDPATPRSRRPGRHRCCRVRARPRHLCSPVPANHR